VVMGFSCMSDEPHRNTDAAPTRSPGTRNPEPGTASAPSPRAVLALAACVGLFAQTAQIVMFREMLAACRGTEVFFGVVLAAGLGWTALGGLLAGLFARRGRRRRGEAWGHRAWAFAAALFALNGLLLVGQVALARHRGAGGAELTFAEAALTAVLATAPVALACGAEFVLALHAARPEDFGRLYQADAWGAVVGGVVFTVVLVALVDPVTLGPLLGMVLCLAVHLAGGRRWMATGFIIGLLGAVGAWGYGVDRRLHTSRWAARHPSYQLVATRDSRYGQLAALRHPVEEQVALYHDGGLVETLPPPDAPATDARNLALFAVAQHPEPQNALLVGRALGHLPRELAALKLQRLEAVELDPALFGLARDCGTPAAEGLPIVRFFADGRRHVQRASVRYHVVVLQLPPPLSALVNRFYTVEFFREARRAMSEDGVLITSVMAAANYPGETVGQLSASILRTLRQVFPEVLVAPGETHTFVAGTRPGLVSLDPAVLGRRIAARGIWLPDADPDFRDAAEAYYTARFENLVITSQVAGLRETLDATPAPVNTDARPIVYQYALLVWNQIVSADTQARDPGLRGGTNALFRAALRFRFGHGLVVPALLVLPALVFAVVGRLRRGGRGALGPAYGILATAFATGLFGMAAEIILLYAFQAVHGYAYAQVGLIVASFMVGLALGARVGTRWERRAGFLAFVVGAMAVYCVLLPLALRGLAAAGSVVWGLLAVPFFVLVFVAGFLDGATFPALVGSMRGLGFQRPGAWVYAADLTGAGLGALATGALLVPVLGNVLALALVAAILAAALAALLPALRP